MLFVHIVLIFKIWWYFWEFPHMSIPSFSFLQLFRPPPKFIYSLVIFSHAHTCVYVYILYWHKYMCSLLNTSVFALVFTLDNLCESSSLSTTDSAHLSILWHPVALHLGVEASDMFPVGTDLSTGIAVFLVLSEKAWCWKLMSIFFLSIMLTGSLSLWILQVF